MKSAVFFLTHTCLFFSILLVMMAFQGAIWLQLFSQFPSPCLWITFLVYGAFYRNLPEAIILTYITSLIAAPFVNLPLGLMVACNSLIMVLLLVIKSRFMISRPIFLSLLTLIMTLLFPVIHYFLSVFIEPNPMQNFEFFSWLISSLLTAIFSISLFQLYIWFDTIMTKSWPTELGRY